MYVSLLLLLVITIHEQGQKQYHANLGVNVKTTAGVEMCAQQEGCSGSRRWQVCCVVCVW